MCVLEYVPCSESFKLDLSKLDLMSTGVASASLYDFCDPEPFILNVDRAPDFYLLDLRSCFLSVPCHHKE